MPCDQVCGGKRHAPAAERQQVVWCRAASQDRRWVHLDGLVRMAGGKQTTVGALASEIWAFNSLYRFRVHGPFKRGLDPLVMSGVPLCCELHFFPTRWACPDWQGGPSHTENGLKLPDTGMSEPEE